MLKQNGFYQNSSWKKNLREFYFRTDNKLFNKERNFNKLMTWFIKLMCLPRIRASHIDLPVPSIRKINLYLPAMLSESVKWNMVKINAAKT